MRVVQESVSEQTEHDPVSTKAKPLGETVLLPIVRRASPVLRVGNETALWFCVLWTIFGLYYEALRAL